MISEQVPLIVLAGPTGSGKSAVAIELALRLGGEIVNYDSVQLYREFDIGSAKPSAADMARAPHHLYGVADPREHLTAADWALMAQETVNGVRSRGQIPILAGGTFFYLRAFLRGLPEMPGRDPELRRRIQSIMARPRGLSHLRRLLFGLDPVSWERIAHSDRNRNERALEVALVSGRPMSSFVLPDASNERPNHSFALGLDRSELRRRIDLRVVAMYQQGLVEETRRLLERYPSEARAFSSIGYREAVQVVSGTMTREQAIAETQRRTRAYAKRQLTWLRSERGMHWITATGPAASTASAIHTHLQESSNHKL